MADTNTPAALVYGTAWKEDKTAELTEEAIKQGFIVVDTANYPTAYNEPLTGDGIAAAIEKGVVKRSDLFIQTKFSPLWAHDKDKIPFDANKTIEEQVRESVQQSLDHLHTDYLDSLLLHAPYPDDADTLAAWRALEALVPHTARVIGVSNVDLQQLQAVYAASTSEATRPAIVQNRFYRGTGFDSDVRAFAREHGITYQAFWMLRHNPEVLESSVLAAAAEKLAVEPELAFYVLLVALGESEDGSGKPAIQVLDGTTKTHRMQQDLKVISEVFGKPGSGQRSSILQDLQPDIAAFRALLEELAAKNDD
ncbi:hypothetical protein SCUCBS95973_009256 [Sporothrix curviconia]|uniref:NADP-dependent oxidoreductase domain-containing protein n=1 Tax=Sporothrix curviconia TaxID=1260050 RepID=A0ABP0CUB2_9PEZI